MNVQECFPNFDVCFLDNRKDVASPQGSNFKSRMKETFNIGKQEVLLKDMNSKLQRMLEETLIKNIQMQQVWMWTLYVYGHK